MSKSIIRMATEEDAASILKIYEYYIINTAITFEYDRIPVEDFKERIAHVLTQFPWLVYCMDDEIAGYAYCAPHLERAAFAWDCECSVYVSKDHLRKGIASKLYSSLFDLVKQQGYYKIYSLICVPNESSVKLHQKFGFTDIGTYCNTGYKLGKWRDLLVMEKDLQKPCEAPKPVLSIQKLEQSITEQTLRSSFV